MSITSNEAANPKPENLKRVLEELLGRLDWNDEVQPIDEHQIWRVQTRYAVNSFLFDCFLEADEEMGWFHVYFYSPITPKDRASDFIGLANEINGKLTFGRFHIGHRIQFKHGADLEGAADSALAALNVFHAAGAALDKWHGEFAKLAIRDAGDEPGGASPSTPIEDGARH